MYTDFLADRLNTFGKLTDGQIFSQNILGYIPLRIRELLTDYMPSHKLHHARTTAKLATGVAKNLVDAKAEALLNGKGNRDIMSLLGEKYDPRYRNRFSIVSIYSEIKRL
jgi:hypothetical protein